MLQLILPFQHLMLCSVLSYSTRSAMQTHAQSNRTRPTNRLERRWYNPGYCTRNAANEMQTRAKHHPSYTRCPIPRNPPKSADAYVPPNHSASECVRSLRHLAMPTSTVPAAERWVGDIIRPKSKNACRFYKGKGVVKEMDEVKATFAEQREQGPSCGAYRRLSLERCV